MIRYEITNYSLFTFEGLVFAEYGKITEKYGFINDKKATPFEKEYVIVSNIFIEKFSGAMNEKCLK